MTRSGGVWLGILVMLDVFGGRPAAAQFGSRYYYGSPWPYDQEYNTRRGYRRYQRLAPVKPAPPRSVEVPLPPPRPRFPGDPPPASDTAVNPPAAASRAPSPLPATPTRPEAPPPAPTPTPPAQPQAPASAAQSPAKLPLGPNLPPLPPEKPPQLANPAVPGVAPSGAKLGEMPGQPVDDATCQARLKDRAVLVEPATIGPQPDARCTVVQAVHLLSLSLPDGGKVDFPEHPTIACTTADTFSSYVRDLLSPLAKGTLGAPISAVWTGPGLECRSMDHIVGAKLSAHGQGLAIDIAQMKLTDGRMIEVGQTKDATTQTFERAAQNAACGYFHTVLGPGTDPFHKTHWHFDLIVRAGDTKYCR